ncbi:MAG TPA: squalene/phytoene synthase family protein [Ramlibacter sp.]|nr:squalene/phytoene synthase family protein [Ramlibacter sp.]
MPALLRGVSRSFYVSIRLLPAQLRQPVSVAYLLARATDTVVDTDKLPAEERSDRLDSLAEAIEGRIAASDFAASFLAAFEPLQADPQARDLILALPRCLRWLEQLAPADRQDVRAVLRHITYGQSIDIRRFPQGEPVMALQTAAQLNEYTYLVAGCVGEFWTELCYRHLPRFARLPKHEMRELGRGYGMGLQLVNILRDARADLDSGRCYFPADELAAAGLRPQDIAVEPERFALVWNRWQAQAQQGLASGMRYAVAVNSRRVRAASAMPALVGARTLALLRSAGPQRLQRTIKVPRHEVRSILARLAFTLAGRTPLQALFGRLQAEPGSR